MDEQAATADLGAEFNHARDRILEQRRPQTLTLKLEVDTEPGGPAGMKRIRLDFRPALRPTV